MVQLIDQFGHPIKKNDLLEEVATPMVSGVRSNNASSISHGLTPEKVARLIKEADQGNIASYLKLGEEIEEKEGHYASVLGTRKRSVAQLEITVEAADDSAEALKHKEFIEKWVERETLEAELVDMLDAIGKGFSITEILWETSESQWLPKDLKWRNPSWFKFSKEDPEKLLLRTDTGAEPLQQHKFITHIHKAKSGLPIRGGVMRPILWMYIFKTFSIKDWVIFSETYGQPIRLGMYGTGASDADRRVLLRAVANIGSDAAAIIPDSMKMEFIESQNKNQTSEVYERLARFCDEQTSKIVLGQTMTTDSGSSRSQAEVHNEVKHDIERSDAKLLATTLNRQLVPTIIDFNYGKQKAYPRVRIGRAENIDIEKTTNAADKLVRMGVQISESDLRSKVGLKAPESPDDALTLDRLNRLPQQTKKDSTSQETASQHSHVHDDLDRFSDDLGDDWEEILTPTIEQIERVAQEAGSYDELIEKLLEISPNISLEDAAQAIAQANFSARIGGELDILEDD